MKPLAFALLVLACALPLHADNWIQNGDFVDGTNHWHGDGRAPADMLSDPMATPDPFLSKGMIIPLRHFDWTKVAQDFKGKIASGILSITYKVSPDLTFSELPKDYHNMPDHIGYDGWKAFDTKPGTWVVFISDFGSSHGTYYMIKPKLSSGEPQTFHAKVMGLTPLEDKTITLAFPPGSGNVVLLNASLTNN